MATTPGSGAPSAGSVSCARADDQQHCPLGGGLLDIRIQPPSRLVVRGVEDLLMRCPAASQRRASWPVAHYRPASLAHLIARVIGSPCPNRYSMESTADRFVASRSARLSGRRSVSCFLRAGSAAAFSTSRKLGGEGSGERAGPLAQRVEQVALIVGQLDVAFLGGRLKMGARVAAHLAERAGVGRQRTQSVGDGSSSVSPPLPPGSASGRGIASMMVRRSSSSSVSFTET